MRYLVRMLFCNHCAGWLKAVYFGQMLMCMLLWIGSMKMHDLGSRPCFRMACNHSSSDYQIVIISVALFWLIRSCSLFSHSPQLQSVHRTVQIRIHANEGWHGNWLHFKVCGATRIFCSCLYNLFWMGLLFLNQRCTTCLHTRTSWALPSQRPMYDCQQLSRLLHQPNSKCSRSKIVCGMCSY